MGNTLLSSQLLLREMLDELKKSSLGVKVVNRSYDDQFSAGGGTLRLNPNAFALAMAPLDITPTPPPAPLNLDLRRAYFDD